MEEKLGPCGPGKSGTGLLAPVGRGAEGGGGGGLREIREDLSAIWIKSAAGRGEEEIVTAAGRGVGAIRGTDINGLEDARMGGGGGGRFPSFKSDDELDGRSWCSELGRSTSALPLDKARCLLEDGDKNTSESCALTVTVEDGRGGGES